VKHVVFGVLLGLCGAFPHLAGWGAAPLAPAAVWVAAQPLVWAFAAGAVVGPRLVRAVFRRLPWTA
jgi:hypothetical protein